MHGVNERTNSDLVLRLLHRNSETRDFYDNPILIIIAVFSVLFTAISWFLFHPFFLHG